MRARRGVRSLAVFLRPPCMGAGVNGCARAEILFVRSGANNIEPVRSVIRVNLGRC